MSRAEIINNKQKNAIHTILQIKFWDHHPSRNQQCICATLNFTGNLHKAIEDKSIINALKINFFSPSDFWIRIFNVTNYVPFWYKAEQNYKQQMNVYEKITKAEYKVDKYENFKRDIFVMILLFLLLIFPWLIYLFYTRPTNITRLYNKWKTSLDDNNKIHAQLKIEHDAYISQHNRIVTTNIHVETSSLGLKFIPYKNFMENCKYNGKAVYILFFKTTNKYYVGQTRQLIKRQMNHINWKSGITKNPHFPETNINDIMISYIKSDSLDEINLLEKEWINKTGSNINGYNSTSGNSN